MISRTSARATKSITGLHHPRYSAFFVPGTSPTRWDGGFLP